MALNLAQKLIKDHLVEGEMRLGKEIAIRVDQTLTQDATGTLVMLELEAMNLSRVRTEISVQYVDHNLLQEDFKNAEDHLFLRSACRRFGIWFSPAGNGVSHPLHQERFSIPGKSLLGSDSHTCAAGSVAMLAIGAGGLEVAMAMAGQPFHFSMPQTLGVLLTGRLPDWVSAKDVVLELLRRRGVEGGAGNILEFFGPGLSALSAMDRHVIANMGAELGATATVFPSDELTRRFYVSQGREQDWRPLAPDRGAGYDLEEQVDLSRLEPMIAMPRSPGNVKPVREVAGQEIHQAYVGSSANPGYRDFAVAAQILRDKRAHERVSLDVNPTSRQIYENLLRDGYILSLVESGARIHQAGCNGCIGMGQAPAKGKLSLRTVPRNFPGRSGERDDQVCLCSPETAAASALTGVITDPRTLPMPYPRVQDPERPALDIRMFVAPIPERDAKTVALEKGANIAKLPEFGPLPERLDLPVLLKVKDDISTDEILPAGGRALPYRSNIPRIAEFAFEIVDSTYPARAKKAGPHAVVAGRNYGQGSSREHAALAPRFLGLSLVLAKTFARIHRQNLVNFGLVPLVFEDPADYDRLGTAARLAVEELPGQLRRGERVELAYDGRRFLAKHGLSHREVEILIAGGLVNWLKARI